MFKKLIARLDKWADNKLASIMAIHDAEEIILKANNN